MPTAQPSAEIDKGGVGATISLGIGRETGVFVITGFAPREPVAVAELVAGVKFFGSCQKGWIRNAVLLSVG